MNRCVRRCIWFMRNIWFLSCTSYMGSRFILYRHLTKLSPWFLTIFLWYLINMGRRLIYKSRIGRGRLFPMVFFCKFYSRKCWINLGCNLFNRNSFRRANPWRKTATWHHWRYFITIRLIRDNGWTYIFLNWFLIWQNRCKLCWFRLCWCWFGWHWFYWCWFGWCRFYRCRFFFHFHINIHINISHIHGIIIRYINFGNDWSRHFWCKWFLFWYLFFGHFLFWRFFFWCFFYWHFFFRCFFHNWFHRNRHFFF